MWRLVPSFISVCGWRWEGVRERERSERMFAKKMLKWLSLGRGTLGILLSILYFKIIIFFSPLTHITFPKSIRLWYQCSALTLIEDPLSQNCAHLPLRWRGVASHKNSVSSVSVSSDLHRARQDRLGLVNVCLMNRERKLIITPCIVQVK